MKQLIVNLLLFGIVFLAVFELFLRTLGLATDVPLSHLYDNGYVLYKAGQEGRFTRGSCAEVSTTFRINQTGWNSVIEYGSPDSNTIALVGDSYIEGFYVDVNASIGRKVEALTDNRYTVHEYGASGANIHDYRALYDDLAEKGYSKIFIYIGAGDFFAKKSSVTGKSELVSDALVRKVYNRLDLLRYLNVNMSIKRLWEKKTKQLKQQDRDELQAKVSALAPKGAIYLFDDSQFKTIQTDLKMCEIVHRHQPKDYGFNGHWNENGAENVAETIVNYLNYQ